MTAQITQQFQGFRIALRSSHEIKKELLRAAAPVIVPESHQAQPSRMPKQPSGLRGLKPGTQRADCVLSVAFFVGPQAEGFDPLLFVR
jgi:hypothetical protein